MSRKITMFHLEECKYCDMAKAALFMPYETIRDGVKQAFDQALED